MTGKPTREPALARYSVVVTCCNQAAFIGDAVTSALLQKQPAKEVIVVDDGSKDGSVEILRRFGSSIKLVVLDANHGAAAARNRGATEARGEYLLFLDGDDLLTPWALDAYDRLIRSFGPSAILSGARWFKDFVPDLSTESPEKIEFFQYPSLMAKDRACGMYIGAFVIDRRAFQLVGGWSPGIFHLDTQDLYAKLAYSGPAIVVHSPYTMLYRMHSANSIRCVPPFLRAARLIMERERASVYPGGPSKKFERCARHGSVILFCVGKGLRAGMYTDALKLLVRGWPMVLAAITRQVLIRAKRRQRMEVLELATQGSAMPSQSAGRH
jgi:glycosyltransferase involved in cell wall biosynthesis